MQGIYQRVTDQIIASLTVGVRPWTRPWSIDHSESPVSRPLRVNGEPYRGINVLMLWSEAVTRSFMRPTWMTYDQARKLGAQVRKGERGSIVVYSSRTERTKTDEQTGDSRQISSSFLRSYIVFNVEQIDNLPARFCTPRATPAKPEDRLAHVEAFVAATKAAIGHGGSEAYYSPSADRIQMPDFCVFTEPFDYYSTLLHELVHWTRHKSRLARDFGQTRFGDHAYAMEELVAELGAAFVCADLQLTPSVRDDHAAYIAPWLKILEQDARAIFTAAAHAQRAVDFLHQLQPIATDEASDNAFVEISPAAS